MRYLYILASVLLFAQIGLTKTTAADPVNGGQIVVDAVDVQVILPEPNGRTGRVSCHVNASGSVSDVQITDPGEGYNFIPRISIEVPPEGGVTPLIERVEIKDGKLAAIILKDGGKGYLPDACPEIVIESPNRPARATAILTRDTLTHIEIRDAGSGYVVPAPTKNLIVAATGWSGGTRIWINEVNLEKFVPGQRVECVDAEGKIAGTGFVGAIQRLVRNAPAGSDGWHVNLAEMNGNFSVGGKLRFGGLVVRFNPSRQARLAIAAERLQNSAIGKYGERLPVENGGGFITLRGLGGQSGVVIRALGYYQPGDNGGGIFYWNPERLFAAPRNTLIRNGGSGYRPGDVLMLNDRQQFLVTAIHKHASPVFPDGQYADYIDLSVTGKVDVGEIKELRAVNYINYGSIPEKAVWSNSKTCWSLLPVLRLAEENGWKAGECRLVFAANPDKKKAVSPDEILERGQQVRGEQSGASGVIGEFGKDRGVAFITLIRSTVQGTFRSGERVLAADGPGSGQPFVKGTGPLDITVEWTMDNSGSIIVPCGHSGPGRWDRLYEDDSNDIRCYGAINDAVNDASRRATDNTWAIQMALNSCSAPGDPARGRYLHVPNQPGGHGFGTGPININSGVSIRGSGTLFGQPGQDVLTTVISPVSFPFNKNNLRDYLLEGVNIVVNERENAVAVGGMAERGTWRERRLYKAMLWDCARNSQRWGAYTFLAAEPVRDRRYFGTDDALDPEAAPPINDCEPARRIYYVLKDTEYADRVLRVAVDPARRGFARTGDVFTLEGGVPLFGSRTGLGGANNKSNFGLPDAGKAAAVVTKLFVPEIVEKKTSLTYDADKRCFRVSGACRTPFLEGAFYAFSLRRPVTDATPQGAKHDITFYARAQRFSDGPELVLSLQNSGLSGGEENNRTASALELLTAVVVKRDQKNIDRVEVVNSALCAHRQITRIVAVQDSTGCTYPAGSGWVICDEAGKELDPAALPARLYHAPGAEHPTGATVLTILWKGAAPAAGDQYRVVLGYYAPVPIAGAANFAGAGFRWVAGPVAELQLAAARKDELRCGSYKYAPGADAIRNLKSQVHIADFSAASAGGPRLIFDGGSAIDDGFVVGMAIRGVRSGAKGVIASFAHDALHPYAILRQWDFTPFEKGEQIVPAFNDDGMLGSYRREKADACDSGELAFAPATVGRNAAVIGVKTVFASENPVCTEASFPVTRTSSVEDELVLTTGKAGNGKDYYPWEILEIKDVQGVQYLPGLDCNITVDSRAQTIRIQWGGEWRGKSPSARQPAGEYFVCLKILSGSPSQPNLPWPEWTALAGTAAAPLFTDRAFVSAKGGVIVQKGADGLVTGAAFAEGKDYTVSYDASNAKACVVWSKGVTPPAGKQYIKYRKLVDDYEHEPWGSPKHLSGGAQHAVLVDSWERYPGNFAWIDYTYNYPGYPPALALGGMNLTFRDVRVVAHGATQANSGGVYLFANYDGNHQNLRFQDTNYGFVMPINLFYPWQNYGIRRDGTVVNRCPSAEGDVIYNNSTWGGQGEPSALVNRFQALLPYTGGSEQAFFKDFQFRCGDIGLFVMDSGFYEMTNIWASGAWSVDRPRGSVMVFGTPSNGVEQFNGQWQFGPLGRMFGEQAINGDYALPAIRCCAVGGGEEVDFGHVTQGRQVIWGNQATGKAAGGRSTIILGGNWLYSMGVWSPVSVRLNIRAGSKTCHVISTNLTGQDGRTLVPLRHGATYYVHIPGTGEGGSTQSNSFTYDSGKPVDQQELSETPRISANDVRAYIVNANIRKGDFNDIEKAKIRTHYGWSLMLCGEDNSFRVSPGALKNKDRNIIELHSGNRLTTKVVE